MENLNADYDKTIFHSPDVIYFIKAVPYQMAILIEKARLNLRALHYYHNLIWLSKNTSLFDTIIWF